MSEWRDVLVGEILVLLAPLKTVVDVQEWPDKTPKRISHPKGAIWVGYQSTRNDTPGFDGTQDGEVQFNIAVFTRNLRNSKGINNLLDAVEELLCGKRLSRGRPLYWKGDQFGASDDGIWRYDVVVAMKMLRVNAAAPEVPTDPIIYGPAVKYALIENTPGGNTEVGEDPDL